MEHSTLANIQMLRNTNEDWIPKEVTIVRNEVDVVMIGIFSLGNFTNWLSSQIVIALRADTKWCEFR